MYLYPSRPASGRKAEPARPVAPRPRWAGLRAQLQAACRMRQARSLARNRYRRPRRLLPAVAALSLAVPHVPKPIRRFQQKRKSSVEWKLHTLTRPITKTTTMTLSGENRWSGPAQTSIWPTQHRDQPSLRLQPQTKWGHLVLVQARRSRNAQR